MKTGNFFLELIFFKFQINFAMIVYQVRHEQSIGVQFYWLPNKFGTSISIFTNFWLKNFNFKFAKVYNKKYFMKKIFYFNIFYAHEPEKTFKPSSSDVDGFKRRQIDFKFWGDEVIFAYIF